MTSHRADYPVQLLLGVCFGPSIHARVVRDQSQESCAFGVGVDRVLCDGVFDLHHLLHESARDACDGSGLGLRDVCFGGFDLFAGNKEQGSSKLSQKVYTLFWVLLRKSKF